MQTMGVTEFKANALKVMDRVAKTKKPILITKRGKPIVQVAPVPKSEESSMGKLAGTITIIGDIEEPLGEDLWEACR